MIARHVLSALILTVLIALAGGSMKDDDKENEKVEKAEATASISAADLFAEYEANEVAADKKYKGKVLEISGVVDDIGKDFLDEMYVTLAAGKHFGHVRASFGEAHADRVASLQKGQSLRLKCRCEGKMMSVMVKNCTFL